MPSEQTPMDELVTLIAQKGIKLFLERTRLLAALVSAEGKLISSNPAFDDLKQLQSDSNTLREIVLPESRAKFDRLSQQLRDERKEIQVDLDFNSEAQPRCYTCLLVPLDDGRLLFFGEPAFPDSDLQGQYRKLSEDFQRLTAEFGVAQDALDRKQKELQAVIAQADEVSHTDALTLLSNRKQIISDLQRQVNFSDRYQQPLAVSILDFDHFKEINDRYGHPVGDDVLRFIALQLRDHVRSPDMIGRYGGEEFLVLLPNSTLQAAGEQAERLCRLVRSTSITTGDLVIHVTVSIGITQYHIQKESWGQLLDRADQALYQAKNNGRDRWAIME